MNVHSKKKQITFRTGFCKITDVIHSLKLTASSLTEKSMIGRHYFLRLQPAWVFGDLEIPGSDMSIIKCDSIGLT